MTNKKITYTAIDNSEIVTLTRETKRYQMKSVRLGQACTITLTDKKTGVIYTKQTRAYYGFNFARVGKSVFIWHDSNDRQVTDYSPFWSYSFTKGYMKYAGHSTNNYNEYVSRLKETERKQKEGKFKTR